MYLQAVINGLLFGFVLNRVVRGSVFITLTFTFGLQIWSADYRSVKLPYSPAGFQIGGVVIPLVRLGIFAVALILTGLFYLFIEKTKTVIAINATALNFEGAKTVGIDIFNIYAITFGVSAALAGAAVTFQIQDGVIMTVFPPEAGQAKPIYPMP